MITVLMKNLVNSLYNDYYDASLEYIYCSRYLLDNLYEASPYEIFVFHNSMSRKEIIVLNSLKLTSQLTKQFGNC